MSLEQAQLHISVVERWWGGQRRIQGAWRDFRNSKVGEFATSTERPKVFQLRPLTPGLACKAWWQHAWHLCHILNRPTLLAIDNSRDWHNRLLGLHSLFVHHHHHYQCGLFQTLRGLSWVLTGLSISSSRRNHVQTGAVRSSDAHPRELWSATKAVARIFTRRGFDIPSVPFASPFS